MSADFDETVHCACFSDEHQLRFIYFKDLKDQFNEIYVSFFLAEHKWYKRIWRAVKYVFGYKSKYGHWGEVVINCESANKIKNLMETYIKDMETAHGTDSLRRSDQGG